MALENNKELLKQARLGNMDGEKGVKFLAGEVLRIQGPEGLNYCEKPYFRSALWEGTWKNHEATVRYLIDKGADVNFKDKAGRTPLHEASRYGHTTLVELLVDHRADIDSLDGAGESPLAQAVSCCRHDVVALLTARGAKLHITDSQGITVQHLAAFTGEPQMADWLYYRGAWKNRYAVEHTDNKEEKDANAEEGNMVAAIVPYTQGSEAVQGGDHEELNEGDGEAED